MTPDIANHTNEFEHPKTPAVTERTVSIPIPMSTQKRAAANFAGQRSMSVIESHQIETRF